MGPFFLAGLLAAYLDIGEVGRAADVPGEPKATDDLVIQLPIIMAPAPGGWKVGNRQVIPGVLEITEFIPQVDDIGSWEELFAIQNFGTSWGEATPELSLKRLQEIREKECPGVTQWTILALDATSVLYEWVFKAPCPGKPVQREIGKILYGRFNRFLVRYTVKSQTISPAARQKWIEALMSAKVELRMIE